MNQNATIPAIPKEIYTNKPSPDQAITMLKEGNKRFVQGQSNHPNLNVSRIRQAGSENQREHAFTTILSCSDSRVPLELIFDAGIMDIFVIRVAGNVCGIHEAGSIEYGLVHVRTPLLIVLGHTQCGAVTTVAQNIQGENKCLGKNINNLVSPIKPAVKRAMCAHPELHGNDIIPFGIEENVFQSIENLFMLSPIARDLVRKGIVKVVGAVYDVSTGRVRWLPESSVERILDQVEVSPKKVVGNASAEDAPKDIEPVVKRDETIIKLVPRPVKTERITLIEKANLLESLRLRDKKLTECEILPEKKTGINFTTKVLIALIIVFFTVFTVFRTIIIANIGIENELFLGFFITIVTSLLVGVGAFQKLHTTQKESDIALASYNMDAISNKIRRVQEAFFKEDFADKSKGDQLLYEHKNLTAAYHDSLANLLKINEDKEELINIKFKMEHYRDKFVILANNHRALKNQYQELEKLGDIIETKLKRLVEKNEERLAAIIFGKHKEILMQTRLVEELVKAEMLYFNVMREKTELLTEKHFDRIEALENALSELLTNFNAIENYIIQRNSQESELRDINDLKKLVTKYSVDISIIILAEINVETALAECNNDLEIIDATFTQLGERAQKFISKAKNEYNVVFVVLMCLYIVGGAYLAFSQIMELTTPLEKAKVMIDKMHEGDYSHRLNFHRNDEIGHLTQSLDLLAEKLEKSSASKDK